MALTVFPDGVEVAGAGTDRERAYLETAGAGAIYLSESV